MGIGVPAPIREQPKMKNSPFYLAPSKIHGIGIFTNRAIKAGTIILMNIKALGNKCNGFNHSCANNIGLNHNNNYKEFGTFRRALRDIKRYEELTVDYRFYSIGFYTDSSIWFGKYTICNCQSCLGKRNEKR